MNNIERGKERGGLDFYFEKVSLGILGLKQLEHK